MRRVMFIDHNDDHADILLMGVTYRGYCIMDIDGFDVIAICYCMVNIDPWF